MKTGDDQLRAFAIYDRDNGDHLGTYHVPNREDALEELAQDAGYDSFAEACADVEGFGEGLEVKKLRS